MVEDATAIQIPTRSRLYCLPIEGTSAADQESILDYAQRLSLEHHLKVRDLFARIILPEAGIVGAFFIPGHFSSHAVRGCNGWSRYGKAFLGAMERLTGQAELYRGSLAAWGAVLSDSGYVGRIRRWCPGCLLDQEPRGFHTFSLAWAFEPVRVCALHRCRLCECCSLCGAPQPLLGELLAAGLCSSCRRPLAHSKANPIDHDDAEDLYQSLAVQRMIELVSRAPSLISLEQLQRQVDAAAAALCSGSLFRLERHLGLSCGALRRSDKPTLRFLLEVARRLGSDPASLLDGTASLVPTPGGCTVPFRTTRRLTEHEASQLTIQLQARLSAAVQNDEHITTRRELIADLGISNALLGARFPKVVQELRRHNDEIRPGVNLAKEENRRREIHAVIRKLVLDGDCLNSAQIGRALAEKGFHQVDPEVRRFVAQSVEQVRQELAGRPS